MKNIILSAAWIACLTAFAAPEPLAVPSTAWRVLRVRGGQFSEGRLSGTAEPGAAILRRMQARFPPDVRSLRVTARGLEAGDLGLSLRGQKDVYALATADGAGTFRFDFAGIPAEFREMRLYVNRRGRFNGKKIELELTNIVFQRTRMLTGLPVPKRRRIFEKTVVFPRIQSKYDLMKNYLSGYTLGSGTFCDRPLFFDRTLADSPLPLYNKLNSVRGFRRQLASALEFTDGFGIFFSERAERFMNPVRAAETGGFKNAIFMETPPTRLRNFAKMSRMIDSVIHSPAVFKDRGRLVIGSYHGDVFSPEEWRGILAPYREKYADRVLFTCELRGLVYNINATVRRNGGRLSEPEVAQYKNRIRGYLEVTDGVNFSGSNHLTAQKAGFPENVFSAKTYARFIVPLLASVTAEPAYAGRKLLGLSAHKGYNQVRHTGSNVDDEGTRGLRWSFGAALSANPDFIVMPEWNEINENTHVEPVVSGARVNQRIMNAMRGLPTPDVERRLPNLVLSFRQENDLAAPIPIELLGLPDTDSSPSTAVLRLLSPTGQVVHSYPAVTFSHRKIEERFHLLPAKTFAACRWLMPELELTWGGRTTVVRRGLPHIRLTTAPNQQMYYVKMPLRDLPAPENISTQISFANGRVEASGQLALPENLTTVELLADDVPIAAVDPRREYAVPPGEVMLKWQRQTPVATGLDHDTVRIVAVKGRIRSRSPHIYSLAGMAVPKLQGSTLTGPVGGGANIREFIFFATPDAVLDISERGETAAKVAVKDILKLGRFRKVDSCGVSWQLTAFAELPEVPFPLDVRTLDFRLSAPLSDRKNAVYTVRAITRAGRVFRSLPAMPEHPAGAPVTVPIWNLLSDAPENLTLPGALARQAVYSFDPRRGNLLAAADGRREHDAMPGGFDYRTHSAPGWNAMRAPEWRCENSRWMLDFKPGCGVLLGPPLFSRSAFAIELTVRFDDTKHQTVLDVLGSKLPVHVIDGELSGAITTRKGTGVWKSPEKIQPNRFYRLGLSYDLTHLRVTLDGRETASVAASGNFADGWILCIGGVPGKKVSGESNVLRKTARATDVPDAGFALSGTLRDLRIANYPDAFASR